MILLSFDIEEFDLPLEYGQYLVLKDQLAISTKGTYLILELLSELALKATFYCTANYAKYYPEVIKKIITEGHELASHGVEHSNFKKEHLKQSKEILEQISGVKIFGFRMPRLAEVDSHWIQDAGYKYNSSLNPTWLPGRYNHFNKSRTFYRSGDLIQVPVSVSPVFRIPLFWLSFHHFPLYLLKYLSNWTYSRDNYVHLYFHPWEFIDLRSNPSLDLLPNYITRRSGIELYRILKNYLIWIKSKNFELVNTKDFLQNTFKEKWI
ncbi:MAG: polysaccharide deacetylase family protein [Sphingobacteriales bacterium]|nr:polysaccharide deacetylase family protein [Sphingobacteriales bacterium]